MFSTAFIKTKILLIEAMARRLIYLLRDEFTTAEGPPLASPRTCQPGPGTLTIVQSDGLFSIFNEELQIPAQATPTWGHLRFVGSAHTRTAGLAMLFDWTKTADGYSVVGWTNSVNPTDHGLFDIGHACQGNGNAMIAAGAYGSKAFPALLTGTYAVICRGAGGFVLAKTGGDWVLWWVMAVGNNATLYPAWSNGSTIGALDYLRTAQLPAPWNTDYGIATDRLAGARLPGDTFTHEANAVIEYTITTLPTAGEIHMQIRRQDASNYWDITIKTNGNFTMNEVVAGAPTYRAGAAAVVSNGDRIVIVADGTTIKGYYDNVLAWTYAAAVNFQTETAGRLDQVDAGAAVTDIIAWPRVLSGAALTALEKYTK